MTKDTGTNANTREARTAEAVLDLIDSLPADERVRLFERLTRHPDNTPLRKLYQTSVGLLRRGERLREKQAKLARLGRSLDKLRHAKELAESLDESTVVSREALEHWKKALIANANSVPKRRLSKGRVETAEAFLQLKKQHDKQISALHALVRLPSERDKPYAVKYRSSKDPEALRQYIKSLMKTYRRSQARALTLPAASGG